MSLELVAQGKTCDIYQNRLYQDLMFFHRTDRFSVGDKVFPGTVQYKGFVLNQMSLIWMKLLEDEGILKTHIVASDALTLLTYGVPHDFLGSIIAAKACVPIPLECIVRGYYIPESKSWDPYKVDGNMYGNQLPAGLMESEILPTPIYTPSTKAAVGEHDENITFEQTIDVIERFLMERFVLDTQGQTRAVAEQIATNLRKKSILAYSFAHEYALSKNIILADTKLEFGIIKNDAGNWEIILIDEAFTPDTSRYWDATTYVISKPQPSMDKQFIRRHIYQVLGWDGKTSPPVVDDLTLGELSQIYCNIYERLFDRSIKDVTTEVSWEWKWAAEKLAQPE